MSAFSIAVITGVSVLLVSEFFIRIIVFRIIVPWQAGKCVEKMLRSGNKVDPRVNEDPKYGQVTADADYLRVSSANGSCAALRWSDIEKVHAYKMDLFTTDLICLAFKRCGKNDFYQVHEQMAGYHDLLEDLPARLPNYTNEWFLSVAFPAFDTRHHVIWRKTPKAPEPTRIAP